MSSQSCTGDVFWGGNDPGQSTDLNTAEDQASTISVEPQVQERKCQAKLDKGWRRVVRNFTPSWFAVTMGTGIVAILCHKIPYRGVWLDYISNIFFALNVILFVLFTFISAIRYILYPEIWKVMIQHPIQSLFVGTFPMGLSTIINMIVFVCVPSWGSWTITLAWALWWIDSILALAVTLYLPFIITSKHKHAHLGSMSAVWLLPVVSTIVAAATGAIVAEVLPNQQHALWTLIISYVLWGTGVPMAMVILVIYFERLAIHHLPPKEVIVSVFLPLGPLGQGGFGIMQLGKVATTVLPKTNSLASTSGDILYTLGFLIALIMWGFGLVWLFFAVATISTVPRFPFNMGWWGMTFPLGVYAVSTLLLGDELPSEVFKVVGTIYSVAVILLWILVSVRTAIKAISGEMFIAPCLGDLKKNVVEQRPPV